MALLHVDELITRAHSTVTLRSSPTNDDIDDTVLRRKLISELRSVTYQWDHAVLHAKRHGERVLPQPQTGSPVLDLPLVVTKIDSSVEKTRSMFFNK